MAMRRRIDQRIDRRFAGAASDEPSNASFPRVRLTTGLTRGRLFVSFAATVGCRPLLRDVVSPEQPQRHMSRDRLEVLVDSEEFVISGDRAGGDQAVDAGDVEPSA